MDIQTAAKYMKVGYRVRRACWEPEEYIFEIADMIEMISVGHCHTINSKTHKMEEHRYVSSSPYNYDTSLEDLLADDWEVITTGIRKEFNKYGHFEYNDEPDWDNYVCKGWGEDEDE